MTDPAHDPLDKGKLLNDFTKLARTYLDKAEKIHDRSKKWYFRPSIAEFNWLFTSLMNMTSVAMKSASLIHSQETIIEALDKEVAELERQVAKLERGLFRMQNELTTISIKNQTKEEK